MSSDKKKKHVDICFPGGGGTGAYYSGAAAYLQDTFGTDFARENDNVTVSCVSAGVWNGLALATGRKIRDWHFEVNQNMIRDVSKNSKYSSIAVVYDHLYKNAYEELDENVHETVNGTLIVGTNQIIKMPPFLKGRVVKEWKSKDDLIQTLMRSSYIPILAPQKGIETSYGLTIVMNNNNKNVVMFVLNQTNKRKGGFLIS